MPALDLGTGEALGRCGRATLGVRAAPFGSCPQVYQDLVKKHPSFRERSENVDLSVRAQAQQPLSLASCSTSSAGARPPCYAAPHAQVEITLQPWHAFKPDGVVLFSDILTPLQVGLRGGQPAFGRRSVRAGTRNALVGTQQRAGPCLLRRRA